MLINFKILLLTIYILNLFTLIYGKVVLAQKIITIK